LEYMRTIPDGKLYYPEPFIASPSFVHEEIWFIHILHYNYWLWFFFISLIMFYFITFIHVVRWCNLRSKPKRETRGVSRSKCADLITACVPVSWALSIIISETVDATDYYDGFGTGEVVIGIRAYQWGWEYFYPKKYRS
jgi:heme/copper-type cytochrome/quinol oxidase subunit 2